MTSLTATDWNDLVENLIANPMSPTFDKIYKYYYKSYDKKDKCDLTCRYKFLCKFKQARPGYLIKC